MVVWCLINIYTACHFEVPHTRDHTPREILIIVRMYKISPAGRYDKVSLRHYSNIEEDKGLKKMNSGEREIMKRHNTQAAKKPMAGTKRHLGKGVLSVLIIMVIGCATAPKPVIIKHQNMQMQGGAEISRTQNQKEVADGSSSSLVELLKKKKVISADEADRFIKEKGAVTSSENIAALVELLEKKNIVSADEAARFVTQSGAPATPEKVTSAASKTTSKGQNAEIPEGVSEEHGKSISDQVKQDEQKNVSQTSMKDDEEQSEKMSEEISNDTPEPVKNDEQNDVPQEAEKDDEEQSGETPEIVSEALKEDSSEAVKNDEQKDVPPEVTTRINDAQIDEIMDGVKEELKSDIHEQVYNQVKDAILEKEPLTQIKKVELEQLAQKYREAIEQQKIKKSDPGRLACF